MIFHIRKGRLASKASRPFLIWKIISRWCFPLWFLVGYDEFCPTLMSFDDGVWPIWVFMGVGRKCYRNPRQKGLGGQGAGKGAKRRPPALPGLFPAGSGVACKPSGHSGELVLWNFTGVFLQIPAVVRFPCPIEDSQGNRGGHPKTLINDEDYPKCVIPIQTMSLPARFL